MKNMSTQAVLAPAKINLRLKIEGLRSDGYHLLSMLNATCSLCDYLTLTYTTNPTFTVSLNSSSFGFLPWLLSNKQSIKENFEKAEINLATRAAKALYTALGLRGGVHIDISKAIPFGAGLAGGSSDAAAVLRAIVDKLIYEKDNHQSVPMRELTQIINQISEDLGSDIKYMLSGGLAQVKGTGEQIRRIALPDIKQLGVILILPELGTSTKDVFSVSRRSANHDKIIPDKFIEEWISRVSSNDLNSDSNTLSYHELLNLIENDLTNPACEVLPLLTDIFDSLKKVDGIITSLSGSGSSVMVFSKISWSPDKKLYQNVEKSLNHLPVELRLAHFYDIKPVFT